MRKQPRNVIVLIADSLRYDSVYNVGVQMPYVQKNAVEFKEARSAGCWTLPATASLFTGLMPHEHGATSQTRAIHKDIPTLAEKMKEAGYATYQVTANIATTHIFGLHRGFDEVRRIWNYVEPKFNKLQQVFALAGKPRLRSKILSKDLLMQKMSDDLQNARTWLQHTFLDVFAHARKIIKENERKGKRTFLFLNLMETHFPYHIAPTFQLDANGIFNKMEELHGLFNMVNQTFLKIGYQNIKRKTLDMLRGRQQKAWASIAPHVNDFCKEMHEDKDNVVVFGADHGENFGDSGWTYHFSNVTDGGNKVPLFWLGNGDQPRKENQTISTRHLYNSLLQSVGFKTAGPCIVNEPERSIPIMQSFWYNNKGATLDKYKYNQFSFLYDESRYLWRMGKWFEAPFQTSYDEPDFQPTPGNANPVEEAIQDTEHKIFLKDTINQFETFSSKILPIE